MMSVRWQSVMLGLLVGALAMGGVGCKKKPGANTAGMDDGIGGVGTVGENGDMTGDQAGRDAFGGAGQAGMFPAVYFDYDSFVVKPEYQSVVENQARYLRADLKRKAMLEGHTDERGGREYNLALGQRRAEAVARAMTLLGVSGGQLEAVSFGKEKPAAQGSDEASLAKNRRVEVKYR